MIFELKAGTLKIQNNKTVSIHFDNFKSNFLYDSVVQSSKIFQKKKSRWLSYNIYFNFLLPVSAYEEVTHNKKIKSKNKRRLYKYLNIYTPNYASFLRHLIIDKTDFLITVCHNFIIYNNRVVFFEYEKHDYRLKSDEPVNKEKEFLICRSFSLRQKFRYIFDRRKIFLFRNSFRLPIGINASSVNVQEVFDDVVKLNSKTYCRNKDSYIKTIKRRLIKGFIGLDDVVLCGALIQALNELDKNSCGFQHGLYDSLMVGYRKEDSCFEDFFKKIYSWSDEWSSVISSLNPESQVVSLSSEKFKPVSVNESSSVRVICMYETYTDIISYQSLINRITSLGHEVVIKLHPNVSQSDFYEEYCIVDMHKCSLVHSLDGISIHPEAVFIGTKTSFLTTPEIRDFKKLILRTNYNFLTDYAKYDEKMCLLKADQILERLSPNDQT